jgi:hypothetical protein
MGGLGKEPPASIDLVGVNGGSAIVAYDLEGRPVGVVSLEVSGGRIGAIYLVDNPQKLQSIPPLS